MLDRGNFAWQWQYTLPLGTLPWYPTEPVTTWRTWPASHVSGEWTNQMDWTELFQKWKAAPKACRETSSVFWASRREGGETKIKLTLKEYSTSLISCHFTDMVCPSALSEIELTLEVKDPKPQSNSLAGPGARCRVVDVSWISSGIWTSQAYRSQGNAGVTEAKGEGSGRWWERNTCSHPEGLGSLRQGTVGFMWDKNSSHPHKTQDSSTTQKEFQGVHNHIFSLLPGVVSHISPSFPCFCTTWFAGSALST